MAEVPTHLSSLRCVCFQEVALATMRKEVDFCRKMDLKVMGIIENMSSYQCPCCQVWSSLPEEYFECFSLPPTIYKRRIGRCSLRQGPRDWQRSMGFLSWEQCHWIQ